MDNFVVRAVSDSECTIVVHFEDSERPFERVIQFPFAVTRVELDQHLLSDFVLEGDASGVFARSVLFRVGATKSAESVPVHLYFRCGDHV